jgi:hypothetical protein
VAGLVIGAAGAPAGRPAWRCGDAAAMDSGKNNVSSLTGPRRLTNPTSMPPAAGRSDRRNGAGVNNKKNHHRLNKTLTR